MAQGSLPCVIESPLAGTKMTSDKGLVWRETANSITHECLYPRRFWFSLSASPPCHPVVFVHI
jgi:hypothetical protein